MNLVWYANDEWIYFVYDHRIVYMRLNRNFSTHRIASYRWVENHGKKVLAIQASIMWFSNCDFLFRRLFRFIFTRTWCCLFVLFWHFSCSASSTIATTNANEFRWHKHMPKVWYGSLMIIIALIVIMRLHTENTSHNFDVCYMSCLCEWGVFVVA